MMFLKNKMTVKGQVQFRPGTPVVIVEAYDWGAVSSLAGSSEDYGAVTAPSTESEDFGSVTGIPDNV